MLTHFITCFLFAFMSILSHMSVTYLDSSFQTYSLFLIFALLMCTVLSLDWCDDITNGYFIFAVLFLMANRLARYNALDISEKLTPITQFLIFGMIIQSFSKYHPITGLLLTGILSLDLVNMAIDTKIDSFSSFLDMLPKDEELGLKNLLI